MYQLTGYLIPNNNCFVQVNFSFSAYTKVCLSEQNILSIQFMPLLEMKITILENRHETVLVYVLYVVELIKIYQSLSLHTFLPYRVIQLVHLFSLLLVCLCLSPSLSVCLYVIKPNVVLASPPFISPPVITLPSNSTLHAVVKCQFRMIGFKPLPPRPPISSVLSNFHRVAAHSVFPSLSLSRSIGELHIRVILYCTILSVLYGNACLQTMLRRSRSFTRPTAALLISRYSVQH